MTGIDHNDNPKVQEAALWFATSWHPRQTPIVAVLRERFGLTALEACEAPKEASLIKARAL